MLTGINYIFLLYFFFNLVLISCSFFCPGFIIDLTVSKLFWIRRSSTEFQESLNISCEQLDPLQKDRAKTFECK